MRTAHRVSTTTTNNKIYSRVRGMGIEKFARAKKGGQKLGGGK